MVAFPVVKLGALLLKQVSKPLANALKNKAKKSYLFRTYVCMPPAQLYHWWDVRLRMWSMNLGKPTQIPKLNESMAIDLGAELLGEFFIFTTAAGLLIAEYTRSTMKESAKEAERQLRFEVLEDNMRNLEFVLEQQSAEIRELTRLVYSVPGVGSKKPTQPAETEQKNDKKSASS